MHIPFYFRNRWLKISIRFRKNRFVGFRTTRFVSLPSLRSPLPGRLGCLVPSHVAPHRQHHTIDVCACVKGIPLMDERQAKWHGCFCSTPYNQSFGNLARIWDSCKAEEAIFLLLARRSRRPTSDSSRVEDERDGGGTWQHPAQRTAQHSNTVALADTM